VPTAGRNLSCSGSYYGEYSDEIGEEIQLNEAEYERGQAPALTVSRKPIAWRLLAIVASKSSSR
jgi:hypothetical protein